VSRMSAAALVENVEWILRWNPDATAEHVAMRLSITPKRLYGRLAKAHPDLWERLDRRRREDKAAHAWRGREWDIRAAKRPALEAVS